MLAPPEFRNISVPEFVLAGADPRLYRISIPVAGLFPFISTMKKGLTESAVALKVELWWIATSFPVGPAFFRRSMA